MKIAKCEPRIEVESFYSGDRRKSRALFDRLLARQAGLAEHSDWAAVTPRLTRGAKPTERRRRR